MGLVAAHAVLTCDHRPACRRRELCWLRELRGRRSGERSRHGRAAHLGDGRRRAEGRRRQHVLRRGGACLLCRCVGCVRSICRRRHVTTAVLRIVELLVAVLPAIERLQASIRLGLPAAPRRTSLAAAWRGEGDWLSRDKQIAVLTCIRAWSAGRVEAATHSEASGAAKRLICGSKRNTPAIKRDC